MLPNLPVSPPNLRPRFTSLSLRENSNLRLEQTLRTLARRTNGEGANALSFALTPFSFLADLRIGDAVSPIRRAADALTRLLFTRFHLPPVICL